MDPGSAAPNGLRAELRKAAGAFAHPDRSRGAWSIATSFGPYLAALAAMYVLFPIDPLLSVLMAIPTGLLLVRVFIIQHDCGHGSFLASARANLLVGRLCSLITLTPFSNWARQHSLHHASWSNLDRRTGADLYSSCLTVREYRALSFRRRFLHRLPRHPLIANVLLPPLVFLVLYRVPFDTPRRWVRERRSVHLTNAALLLVFAALGLVVGWEPVLVVQVSIMVVASIVGVWLFSVQHRFETAHWARREGWNAEDASMAASSWLDLPAGLQWLTGSIGFHHIHHLNPRVPSYRLQAAHEAVQRVWKVRPIHLRGGLRAPWLTLWDEDRQRLVRFRDV